MNSGNALSNEVIHPHLLISCSREGHLEVVEPGRSDCIEPVDHFLVKKKNKKNPQLT